VGLDADERGAAQGQQETVFVLVERAPGRKCERCWNWSEVVGTLADAPELCDRCAHTLK
jgi:isoleucyl-tRNA synthetase